MVSSCKEEVKDFRIATSSTEINTTRIKSEPKEFSSQGPSASPPRATKSRSTVNSIYSGDSIIKNEDLPIKSELDSPPPHSSTRRDFTVPPNLVHPEPTLAEIESLDSQDWTLQDNRRMTTVTWSAPDGPIDYASETLELQECESLRPEREAVGIRLPNVEDHIIVNTSYMEHVRQMNIDVPPWRNPKVASNVREKRAMERYPKEIPDNSDEHFYKDVRDMAGGTEAIRNNFCFGRALKTKKSYERLSYF